MSHINDHRHHHSSSRQNYLLTENGAAGGGGWSTNTTWSPPQSATVDNMGAEEIVEAGERIPSGLVREKMQMFSGKTAAYRSTPQLSPKHYSDAPQRVEKLTIIETNRTGVANPSVNSNNNSNSNYTNHQHYPAQNRGVIRNNFPSLLASPSVSASGNNSTSTAAVTPHSLGSQSTLSLSNADLGLTNIRSLQPHVDSTKRTAQLSPNASTQTEVLTLPSGATTLVERGNYKANVQILIAELDAAKDLNKKLSVQLSQAERDLKSQNFQKSLQVDEMDATLASRLADVVEGMHLSNGDSSAARSRSHDDEGVALRALTAMDDGSAGGNHSSSHNPDEIARNCDRMMEYIRRHGCQINEQPSSEAVVANDGTRSPDQVELIRIRDQQVDRLKAELEEYQRRSVELERELNQKVDDYYELEKSLIQANSRAQNLEKTSHNQEEMIRRLDENLRLSRASTDSIGERGSVQKSDGEETPPPSVDLDAALRTKDQKITAITNELTHAKERNAELMSAVTTLQKKTLEWQSSEGQLKTALSERESEVDILRKKLKTAEQAKQQWEVQQKKVLAKQPLDVRDLQTEKRELIMQLEREQNEKQELFLQINTLIAQLADTHKESPDRIYMEENAGLRKEVSMLTAGQMNQTQLEADVAELQEEVKRKSDQVELTRAELQKVRQNFDAERERLTNEIAALDSDLRVKSAAVQSMRLAQSGSDTERLEGQLKSERECSNQLAEKVNELEHDKRVMEENAAEVQNQLTEQLKRIAEFEQMVQNLETQQKQNLPTHENEEEIQQLKEKLVKKEDTIIALRHQVEDQKELKDKLQRERNDDEARKFSSELKEKEDVISELRQQLKDMRQQSGETVELRTELREKTKTIADLQDELQGQNKEIDRLREQSEELKYLQVQLEQRSNELESTKSDSTTAAEQLSKEKQKCIGLERELEQAKAEQSQNVPITKYSILLDELKMVEEQKDSLKSDLDHAKIALEQSKVPSEEFISMTDKYESAKRDAEKFKGETLELKGKLEQVSAKADQLTTDREEAMEKMKSDRDGLRSEVESLQEDLSRIRNENARLQHALESAEVESDAEKELGQVKEVKEELMEEISRLKMKHEQQESRWNHEVYEAQQRYQEADEQRHSLKEEVAEMRRQLDQMERTVEQKEAELLSRTSHGDGDGPGTSPKPAPRRGDADGGEVQAENKKLKAELEKQQRLVGVLRRKLQQASNG